jgi:hypothetical protein
MDKKENFTPLPPKAFNKSQFDHKNGPGEAGVNKITAHGITTITRNSAPCSLSRFRDTIVQNKIKSENPHNGYEKITINNQISIPIIFSTPVSNFSKFKAIYSHDYLTGDRATAQRLFTQPNGTANRLP